MICVSCGKENKFGRYFHADGVQKFECGLCLDRVNTEISKMMSGEKQSAGQIVRGRLREKLTLKYKIKKFFGLVNE